MLRLLTLPSDTAFPVRVDNDAPVVMECFLKNADDSSVHWSDWGWWLCNILHVQFAKTKLYSVNSSQPETLNVLIAETDLLIQKRSSVHRASLNLLELKRGRKCLTPVEGKLKLFQKCQAKCRGWEYQASDFYVPLMVCFSYASITHFLWIII